MLVIPSKVRPVRLKCYNYKRFLFMTFLKQGILKFTRYTYNENFNFSISRLDTWNLQLCCALKRINKYSLFSTQNFNNSINNHYKTKVGNIKESRFSCKPPSNFTEN